MSPQTTVPHIFGFPLDKGFRVIANIDAPNLSCYTPPIIGEATRLSRKTKLVKRE